MKRILIYISIILIGGIIILWGQNKSLREENNRLSANSETLLSQVDIYKNSLGQSVAHVGKLELQLKELKIYNERLLKTVSDMGIKLRRTQSLSLTSIESKFTFSVPLITNADTPGVPVRSFIWNNPWNRVEGYIRNDSIACSVKHIDTLNQVVYRVPHKFLFLRWGTKAIRQAVSLADTSSTIVYSEYIVLKRKK